MSTLENVSYTKEFIKKLSIIFKEFEYFSDSFYSYWPFEEDLYYYWVFNFHLKIRNKINSYWNKRMITFLPLEVLEFSEIIIMYSKTL